MKPLRVFLMGILNFLKIWIQLFKINFGLCRYLILSYSRFGRFYFKEYAHFLIYPNVFSSYCVKYLRRSFLFKFYVDHLLFNINIINFFEEWNLCVFTFFIIFLCITSFLLLLISFSFIYLPLA